MLYGEYQFLCRFGNEAILPNYKGSTLRGVFGRSLKKIVCALKNQECEVCLLKERCLYTVVFETSKVNIRPKNLRISSIPHPFIIEPPLTSKIDFMPGDLLDFNLILFGDTNNNLPYFIYAFDQIGKTGIGKKINENRGQFVLEQVKMGQKQIYSNIDQTLNTPSDLIKLNLTDNHNVHKGIFKLKIILETPLRLKFNNQLKADLPFHILVRGMLRRVSSLLTFYGNGEPDLDYQGLVEKAFNIKILNDNLSWYDWRRYSFRQDQEMLMGGMVGSITYEGELGEYIPFIEFCSKVHIGKQTAFGLGKIKAVY